MTDKHSTMEATRREFLYLAAGAGLWLVSGPEIAGGAEDAKQALYPVEPYISDSQFLPIAKCPKQSFYLQPWRSYLETVPATAYLSALGINYNLPSNADDDAVCALLAGCGFRSARIEVAWANVPWTEDELNGQDRFVRVFTAMKAHGIRPLILLNANSGYPCPAKSWQRTVTVAARQGATSITFDSTADFTPNYTGLSASKLFRDLPMAGCLFTSINSAANTVQLSQPLPGDIAAGSQVQVNQLKYLPFYPVGTPQFEETAAGWMKWVSLVMAAADQAGLKDFDVEIWNELSFGSAFVSINKYYEPRLIPKKIDYYHPGGCMWEITHRTVDFVKKNRSGVRAIWGFSNTEFYHTPIELLPPGMDGRSYHPYGTTKEITPKGFPEKRRDSWFIEGYIPQGLVKCMPEGWAHLGIQCEELMQVLRPDVRTKTLPAASTSFIHCMTEHGCYPPESGITTTEEALPYMAKALVRETLFWIHKGISLMDIYCAYSHAATRKQVAKDKDKQPNTGYGLMLDSPDPKDYAQYKPEQLLSPALQALKNTVACFEGAQEGLAPRPLTVRVAATGPQTNVFDGDGAHPPLYTRDMFAFLPFQVTSKKFVCAVYVMTYDITAGMEPMEFFVTLDGIDGNGASLRYYDPVTNDEAPVRVEARNAQQLIVRLPAIEYPRLLILDQA